MKIMLHISHKLKKDIVNVIELNIYQPSSSTLMSIKRMMKLMFSV